MMARLRHALWPLVQFSLVALVFSLAYGQAPLYYSNQNQYFLHGLAEGGHGYLADDWLAQTTDPTPVFSLLVALTYRYLPAATFHLYYALVLGIYACSLLAVFDWLAGPPVRKRARLCFLALLVLVHCALIRWLSYRWLGSDYPWFLQAGVAGQYVLGAMFQPSVFGVLLIASLVCFLKDRPWLAVLIAGMGAILHSTYLPGAAMLALGYVVVLVREGRWRQALGIGALAGAMALPVLLYVCIVFQPASADSFAEAQRILVHERIPHHCLPQLWCDPIAVGQILWILLALGLVWRTRLFPVLAIVFVISTILTVVQIVTSSDALALLFPWRVSAFLMPVATAIILGRLVLLGSRWLDTRVAAILAVVLLLVLGAAGVIIMAAGLGYQTTEEELPMLDWVRNHKQRSDVYLLPVQVPKLAATTRGSLSSDFKPLAQKRSDARIIPVDLQRFRLYTGAPIFVDFKSVPYRDVDVLEWHRRLEANQGLLDGLRAGEDQRRVADLRRHGITHVILPAEIQLPKSELQCVYQDRYYRILHLTQIHE
jgi:hypothetical protein